jgi:hypothetical protein
MEWIDIRLSRIEKTAKMQGQTPPPDSIPIAHQLVCFGKLSDLYRDVGMDDVFGAADGDLYRLLEHERKPAGAEEMLYWLIRNDNNTDLPPGMGTVFMDDARNPTAFDCGNGPGAEPPNQLIFLQR